LIGKSDRGWMLYDTVPSLPVGASVGVELTIGVERMKTSAPWTRCPFVSLTVIVTWIGTLLDVTGFGLKTTLSTVRRSPVGPTSLTLTAFPPPPPPPPPPLLVTTAVVSERPEDDPALFLAVTLTRRRLPTSGAPTV
jgi:hypothetical protein